MTTNPLHFHPLFIQTLANMLANHSDAKDVLSCVTLATTRVKLALENMEPPDAAHAQMTPGSEREVAGWVNVREHHVPGHSCSDKPVPLGIMEGYARICSVCAAALAGYEAKQQPVHVTSIAIGPDTINLKAPAAPIASAEAFAQLLFKHGFTADSAGLGWKAQIGKLWLEIEQSFARASEELRESLRSAIAKGVKAQAECDTMKLHYGEQAEIERAENNQLRAKLAEATAKLDAGGMPVRFEVFAEVLKQKQDAEEKLAEVTRERDECGRQTSLIAGERNEALDERDAAIRERDEARVMLRQSSEQFQSCADTLRRVQQERHDAREQRDAASARAEQAEKQLQGHNDALVVAFCQGGHARSEATAYNWIYEAEKAARTLLAAGKLGVKE